MSTIKILTDTESESDIKLLSAEEREIVFDQLAAESADIPREYFTQFMSAFNEELDNTLQAEMPDLPELLLKHIINMSCNVTNSRVNATTINRPNTILPIVSNAVYGGDVPLIKRALKPKYVTDEGPGIRIQFDRSILVSNENGKIFNTAPGDNISVIGIRTDHAGIYPRDVTYKNVRGVMPLGAYRADDIFDDIGRTERTERTEHSENGNTKRSENEHLIKQVFERKVFTTKFMFQGDTKKQLMQVFTELARYIYMPTSFGKFAYTMIGVATATLPRDVTARGRATAMDTDAVISTLASILFPLRNVIPQPIPDITPSTDPILQLLNSLGAGAFIDKFKLAVTTNVYGRGLARIYNGAVVDGIDASKVRSQLVLYTADKKRRQFDNKVKIEKADKEILNATFRNIVLAKLGKKRADEIQFSAKDDPLTFQTEGILPFLKPAERKLVEIEYQKQIDYTRAVIGNKCPHVSLYRRLRRSTDNITSIKLLSELRKYYVGKAKTGGKVHTTKAQATKAHMTHVHTDRDMIKCNNCGFNIICPHYDEYISLTAESDRSIKIKMSKYISNESSQERDTFCKICGEVLSSIEALEGTTDEIPENMDEELRNFIWSEIAINMKFFKFGPMVEVGKLIGKIRDGIYTYIFNVEKQILRSKTATADEVKARKRLFVAIYSFAYMVHLIMSNIGKDIIGLQNFKITDPKRAIPELIKRSLELIILSRSITIKEIPGISIDIIRNSLVTAYKEITHEGKIVVTSESVDDRQIDLDPVFTAIVNMKVLDAVVDGRRFDRDKILASIQDKVLENFSKKAVKNGIFSEVLTLLNWNDRAFVNMYSHVSQKVNKPAADKSTHSGKSTNNSKNSDHGSIFAQALPGYVAASYNIIVRYIKEKLFDYYSAESPSAYTTGLEELETTLADIRKGEAVLLRHKSMGYPHVHTALTQSEHKFTNPEASIARIYDEEGRAHVWNIYVYDTGDVHEEYRASEIAKIISGGKRFDQTPSDKKCSVCGVLQSQTSELDVEKIRDSLRSAAMLDNFFRFYETRCPKGDLHIYEATSASTDSATSASKCTKCGITSGSNALTAGGLNIFRQYKASYLRDRNEINSSVIPEPVVHAPRAESPYAAEYSSFAPNFSVVTSLADKLGVNQKLLLALGATEKIEYNDVLTGKYIPREVEEKNAPRIYTLDAYLRSLYIEWNQLRIFHRFQRPGSDISKLIEASGIPRHEINNVIATLPDIYDDYSARFDYIRKNMKPRNIVSFCIQTICEKALAIYSVEGPGAQLARTFAEYIIKKFLRNDELVSKPGYFSWSTVFGDKESKRDLVETDAEPATEQVIDTTDDLNEAAMSLEAFDVEEDPEAEPDDDPANQVRVGENYGMD